MKKLFTMLVASVCFTMAFAQTEVIKMSDVNLKPGSSETLYVTIDNPTKYTAFQFDLKLPKGVSVKDNVATIGGTSSDAHVVKNGVNDEGTNTYRFLSYDMDNTVFGEGAKVKITLDASKEAEAGTVTGTGILFVDPKGESTTQETASAMINVAEEVKIVIPAGEKLAMVCAKALDFSSLEAKGVKAYICTGNEVSGNKNKFWLTRVNDIPANTPILVKGAAGEYSVPVGSASIYYPENYLAGDASETSDINWDGFKNFAVILDEGTIVALPTTVTNFDPGKAYFHVPSTIASTVVEAPFEFKMEEGGKLAMVKDYDLDFTEVADLKAYTVTGYGKDRVIWMTRVMKVSAGTPLLLRGTPNADYSIPSSVANVSYVNMLEGNNSDEAVLLNPTMDDKTILVVILASGQIAKLGVENAPFEKGKAWLPVPTSYYEGTLSTRGTAEWMEYEAEVICLEAIIDGNATGINKVASEVGNDVWYNLSGQRISTPTKKGVYIKNGKKVIVK